MYVLITRTDRQGARKKAIAAFALDTTIGHGDGPFPFTDTYDYVSLAIPYHDALTKEDHSRPSHIKYPTCSLASDQHRITGLRKTAGFFRQDGRRLQGGASSTGHG